jgi:hypothetical protein
MCGLWAVLLILSVDDLAAERPSCRDAEAWVEQHADALPATAAAFEALSPVHQRYTFNALAPEIKSHIWRERLAGVLSARQLSLAQRALVTEGISIFSPEFYRFRQTVPEEWREQVAAAFSRADAATIFETLGPSSTFLEPSCSCNDDNDCTGGRVCSLEICNPTVSGCGPGGSSSCGEGVCRFP